MRALLALPLCLLAVAMHSASAQGIDGMRAGVFSSVADSQPRGIATLRSPMVPGVGQYRRYAPMASAIVPGAGQFLLGNDRFIGYVAVEAISWWMYSKDISERRARESQFKDLAREVARVHYTSTFPDAQWSYYEWMRDFLESGAYSKMTSGPVVPETDTSTYNGKKWATLQSIHPTTAEALAQYEREAIKPEFQWSWKNHRFEWNIYSRYTDGRNDANRAAMRDLLLIGANHLLSTFDAFTTARLQIEGGGDGQMRVGANLRW